MHFDKYPKEMPVQEIGLVVAYLKGDTSHDLHCVAGACWWVVGYGMSYIPSDHKGVAGAMDDAALAEQLEVLLTPGVKAIPWALVMPLLLKLAERIINRL